jgi:hypothetical protein
MRFKMTICLSLICQLGFAQETPPILDRALHGIQSTLPKLNIELKADILAMCAEDQSVRLKISDYKNISEEEQKNLSEVEAKHNLQLKKIISEYKWPGIHLVGIEGAMGIWLLVQHQDHDLAFQKQCLVLLKEAVEKQDAQYREYAYLLDRIRKNESLLQVYGTQWEFKDGKCLLFPVEVPENLNQRRLEAGLNSIEEYREEMKKAYHLEDVDISVPG